MFAPTQLTITPEPAKPPPAPAQRDGRCRCCGRRLTDPARIAAGVGPVCAANPKCITRPKPEPAP
jgi:hypothetical protein